MTFFQKLSVAKENGNSGELINTRISGEYVKIDNKVYRIVGIENGTTKLTSVDYVRNNSSVMTKKFGSTTSWADSVASGNNDYWGYYLNNTWLTQELKKYITDGTYYLKQTDVSSSFKNAICSTKNTTEPTSSCPKTTSTWTGLVGLPRVGEMFSSQLGKDPSSSSIIWLITPRDNSNAWHVNIGGSLGTPSLGDYGVRPSINLKSEVIITGGDGMSEETAYTIGL